MSVKHCYKVHFWNFFQNSLFIDSSFRWLRLPSSGNNDKKTNYIDTYTLLIEQTTQKRQKIANKVSNYIIIFANIII